MVEPPLNDPVGPQDGKVMPKGLLAHQALDFPTTFLKLRLSILAILANHSASATFLLQHTRSAHNTPPSSDARLSFRVVLPSADGFSAQYREEMKAQRILEVCMDCWNLVRDSGNDCSRNRGASAGVLITQPATK